MPGEGALVLYNNSPLLAYIRSYSPDLTETDRRVTFTAPFVFAAGGRRTRTHTRDVIKNWPRNKTRCAVVGGGGGGGGRARPARQGASILRRAAPPIDATPGRWPGNRNQGTATGHFLLPRLRPAPPETTVTNVYLPVRVRV